MKKLLKITLTLVITIIVVTGIIIPEIILGTPASPAVGNWYQQFITNLGGRQINDITFTDSLRGFAITNEVSDTSFLLRTTNGGDNWTINHFDNGICSYYSVQFLNTNTGFVSGYIYNGSNYRLLKTTNGGNTWIYVDHTSDIVAIDMHVLSVDTIWVVDSGSLTGGVYRTTNGGANWDQQLNLGSSNPDRIYMVNGQRGFISKTNTYTRITTNSGLNWNSLLTGSGEGFYDMYFANDLTGWGIYFNTRKTTNGGINWTVQQMPSGGNIISSAIVNFAGLNKDTIYGAGAFLLTGSGFRGMINRTTNGGISWQFQVPDSSTIQIGDYSFISFIGNNNGWAYRNSPTGIHTTTGGDPVWYTGLIKISELVPNEYSLEQNFPNPFNPKTIIRYQISNNNSFVQISVYDIQGKLVTELVNQKQSPGTYEVDFSGNGYSSGVYFYSLLIGGVLVGVKTMILLK